MKFLGEPVQGVESRRTAAGIGHRPAKGVEMELTCSKCGYSGEFTEFRYLCKNG